MNNIERNGFSEQPICDSHLHNEKATIVDRALEIYEIICDYYNYERINICCLTGYDVDFIDPGSNLKALYVKSKMNEKTPDKCYVYGHIHHYQDGRDTADGYLRQVKQLYAMGVDGYKFIEGKPGFRKQTGFALDDPIYDKMYEFIEKTGLPVVHHVADPEKCWDISRATPIMIERGWVYDESYRTLAQLRAETEGLLTKFPNLKVTLAHFYFISDELEAARELMEKYPNVSLDVCPGGEMFVGFSKDHDGWRKFFVDFADRIYFGTDTYNSDCGDKGEDYEDSGDAGHRINFVRLAFERSEPFEDKHYGTIIPLNLPEDVRKKIYHDNFVKRQGSARAVNKEICAEAAACLAESYEHGTIRLVTHGTPELELDNIKTVYEYFSK